MTTSYLRLKRVQRSAYVRGYRKGLQIPWWKRRRKGSRRTYVAFGDGPGEQESADNSRALSRAPRKTGGKERN